MEPNRENQTEDTHDSTVSIVAVPEHLARQVLDFIHALRRADEDEDEDETEVQGHMLGLRLPGSNLVAGGGLAASDGKYYTNCTITGSGTRLDSQCGDVDPIRST